MFRSILEKWKQYCERNEIAHAANQAQLAAEKIRYKNAIPPLSVEATELLRRELEGELYVLEVHNDDITPMAYVIEVAQQFSPRDEFQAVELAHRVHAMGSGLLITGNKMALECVANHIERDARARNFPFKCIVSKT